MIIKLENLMVEVNQSQENEAGEIEILDEVALRRLGGLVFREVVRAFLVDWEDDWYLVVWWEAEKIEWELLSNQASFRVELT